MDGIHLPCPNLHTPLSLPKFPAIKTFNIPSLYRSSITGRVKEIRKIRDLRKQDFSPSVLDFGPVEFYIARHFGFCYGVENAIEISYRALEENPDKKAIILGVDIGQWRERRCLCGRTDRIGRDLG